MLRKIMLRLVEYLLALLLLAIVLWFVVTQPSGVAINQYDTPTVNAKTLRHAVEMLSERLPARIGDEKSLTPTAEWIEQQLKPYGTTERQTYTIEGEQFHNIILTLGSKSKTAKTIVIGAHYDTFDGLVGADDNASGVAGLIELARLLSQTTLLSRVELVFYTLEEPPAYATNNMGSYIHAQSLKEEEREVVLMMSLEMIGYFSDAVDSQHYPLPYMDHFYPNQGNFIAIVSNMGNMMSVRRVKNAFRQSVALPVYSINAPSSLVQGIDFSDHQNYWLMGYPAVMVTDTAFSRNTAYHTAQDTADRLDYEKMTQVVQATFYTVLQYDKDEDVY